MFDVLFVAIPTLAALALAFARVWLSRMQKCILGLACFAFAVSLTGLALGALGSLSEGVTLVKEIVYSFALVILFVLAPLWIFWGLRGAAR